MGRARVAGRLGRGRGCLRRGLSRIGGRSRRGRGGRGSRRRGARGRTGRGRRAGIGDGRRRRPPPEARSAAGTCVGGGCPIGTSCSSCGACCPSGCRRSSDRARPATARFPIECWRTSIGCSSSSRIGCGAPFESRWRGGRRSRSAYLATRRRSYRGPPRLPPLAKPPTGSVHGRAPGGAGPKPDRLGQSLCPIGCPFRQLSLPDPPLTVRGRSDRLQAWRCR